MQWRHRIGILAACIAVFTAPAVPAQDGIDTLLDRAISGAHRSEANRLRDKYRHPRETLLFFGLRPDMTVVEIWPGGGWYAEILIPYLRQGGGTYYAATMGERGPTGVRRLIEANPQLYAGVRFAEFPVLPGGTGTAVPAGTAG